jgi:hypothetical protein
MPGVDQYHMQYPVSLVVHAPAKHRLEPLMDVFLLVPLWPAPHASFHPRHHPHTALFHLHTPPPLQIPVPTHPYPGGRARGGELHLGVAVEPWTYKQPLAATLFRSAGPHTLVLQVVQGEKGLGGGGRGGQRGKGESGGEKGGVLVGRPSQEWKRGLGQCCGLQVLPARQLRPSAVSCRCGEQETC